jgi:hypothetical protein
MMHKGVLFIERQVQVFSCVCAPRDTVNRAPGLSDCFQVIASRSAA